MLKKLLAKWLLGGYSPMCSGAAGIIEKEVTLYQRINGKTPQQIAVPQFVYEQFIREHSEERVEFRSSFAGVQVVASESGRFEF